MGRQEKVRYWKEILKGSVPCKDGGIKVSVIDVDNIIWDIMKVLNFFLHGSHCIKVSFHVPLLRDSFPRLYPHFCMIISDWMVLVGNLKLRRRCILLCPLFPSKDFVLNLYEDLTGIFSKYRNVKDRFTRFKLSNWENFCPL